MLETCLKRSLWEPPNIDIGKLISQAKQQFNVRLGESLLYVFRTSPYIDTLYVEYDSDHNPIINKRFTFCEGFTWNYQDEIFFHKRCVSNTTCTFDSDVFDEIYEYYNRIHPEWKLQRYMLNRIRLLDHIYNCMRKNTAKELLYKAGLDELAVNIYELDELNLLSTKPSDIFDGVPMKALRGLNCKYGIKLLNNDNVRSYVKEINSMHSNIFNKRLNDAQCLYMQFLIENKLTPIEVGRLFEAHKGSYERIWCLSQIQDEINEHIKRQRLQHAIEELKETIGSIDPIYMKYIKKTKNPILDSKILQLKKYLGVKRSEYDDQIRRNNRKKNQEWQEKDHGYVVRFPQTINDFCREAIYMQNCLLGYVPALLENDTTILFIRELSDVNKPFITMEIHNGQLTQAFHRFDEDCSDEEMLWIMDYCSRHDIACGLKYYNGEWL